jgi:hypothetical protein
MTARLATFLFALVGSALFFAHADQQAAPERVRLAFAPAKGSAYLLEYVEDSTWNYGDRKGTSHVAWTMRHRVKTVSKKGKVFLESEFTSAKYRADYEIEGKPEQSGFAWTPECGFVDAVGEGVERVGKKEIPAGLKLVLDPRGAADSGSC